MTPSAADDLRIASVVEVAGVGTLVLYAAGGTMLTLVTLGGSDSLSWTLGPVVAVVIGSLLSVWWRGPGRAFGALLVGTGASAVAAAVVFSVFSVAVLWPLLVCGAVWRRARRADSLAPR